jgi:hypothetical protein
MQAIFGDACARRGRKLKKCTLVEKYFLESGIHDAIHGRGLFFDFKHVLQIADVNDDRGGFVNDEAWVPC